MADYPYRKLYRCNKNHMVAGVCAGLANYFNVDPTIIRLFTVLLVLLGGLSFWVYIILWIVIPLQPTRKTINAGEKDPL